MFSRLCRKIAENTLHNSRNQAQSAFWYETGALSSLAIVMFVSIKVLHVDLATMFLLFVIFSRLMPQFTGIYSKVEQLATNLPAFSNIMSLKMLCVFHAQSSVEQTSPVELSRSLELKDLWFSYRDDSCNSDTSEEVLVLRDINLEIKANQTTAIIGASGSGKSTIVDVASGLLVPKRGNLVLDGAIVDETSRRGWRNQVGYVGQDTVLFHGSIRSNLQWANPNATESEMKHALEMASATFVYDTADGLDAQVGDRGSLFSNGERQRIALARALVRKPTLLILDEATNALDVENETQILSAIKNLHRSLSVLLVAHRTSAVKFADYIYEIHDGVVGRSGTLATLGLKSSN
jgi:ATP-binding cassette subfamily C protein